MKYSISIDKCIFDYKMIRFYINENCNILILLLATTSKTITTTTYTEIIEKSSSTDETGKTERPTVDASRNFTIINSSGTIAYLAYVTWC